ncbi:unnamed protein product [Toxocara canis]|uniref:Dipeptidyl peptidase n=1 Tax=Toxocara canis TaxID=6265 RepID=A0A183TVI8_TOXCA|nr:unnamed protein product [Toxocara canis]
MIFQSKGLRSKTVRLCVRFLVLLFVLFVVISLAIAVALILTQKPVDLSQIGTSGKWLPAFRNQKSCNDTNRRSTSSANYSQLTIESLLMGAGVIQPEYFSVWLSDDRLVMLDGIGNFVLISTSDLSYKPRIFIDKDQFKADPNGKNFIFNSDAQLIALSKGLSQVYRHSNKALYEVARLEASKLVNHQPIGPRATGDEALQLFEWNPHLGAQDFVFVYENNIYYQADANKPGSALPITVTGTLFNYHGVTDWLYEEEIFSSSKAVWWSLSGNYLAYASFDDRRVSRITVPHYDSADVYPRHEEIPYPKAGTDNQPLVFLRIWNKELNSTQSVDPPAKLTSASKNNSYYLFSVCWIQIKQDPNSVQSDDILLSVWSNRQQNEIFISPCRYGQLCNESLYVSFDIDERKMWSEPSDFKIEYQSANGYFVLLPRKYKNGNIYNHIAHVNLPVALKTGGSITAYHGGSYDVKQIVGYDRRRDEIYFLAAGDSMAQMFLYRAQHATNGDDNVEPECITCSMESCPSSRVNFAPSGKQFILSCPLAFYSTKTYLKKVDEISSDILLRDDFQAPLQYDPPKISYEKIPMKSGIGKPAYLIYCRYSGPNSNLNSVETPWDLMSYFANRRQYVIVTIDARGSSNRGWLVKEQLYMNLSGPEVDDQIEVTRKLLQIHSFLDRHRVAVLGWSYGGFVAAHIATRDQGSTFQCAICIAPVVNFRFYDSAYTERYMGLPRDNIIGYEVSVSALPIKS